MIRVASVDDAAGASALFALITPEFVSTAASTRHYMTSDPPEAKRRWWCAESDGQIVGWASLGLVVDTSEKGLAWLSINVHPDHRGRGIGTELAELAEARAASIGARKMHSWSRTDDATVAFARARGFEQKSAHDLLVVDPRTGNDVTNAPMLAINRKLGYAPSSSMLNWAKTLVTT